MLTVRAITKWLLSLKDAPRAGTHLGSLSSPMRRPVRHLVVLSLLLSGALARAEAEAEAEVDVDVDVGVEEVRTSPLAGQPAGPVPGTPLQLDGELVFGLPAALPTGLSTGLGAGFTMGGALAWGGRLVWSSATEFATDWEVRHDDVRLRLEGVAQRAVGRGNLALRLGLGPTVVREARTRNQGARAGLTGDELTQTAWTTLAGAELELVVTVRMASAWALVVSGGPSYHVIDGQVDVGWLGALGVAWRR